VVAKQILMILCRHSGVEKLWLIQNSENLSRKTEQEGILTHFIFAERTREPD
jgi:hypothetical protein